MHRIPVSSEQKGVHSLLAQYELTDTKDSKRLQKKIFDNIGKYVLLSEDINNIIIVGDYNQYVADKKV